MDGIKRYGKKKSELDQLVQIVRILSQDIGMEFGISKCALLVMKRGKFCQRDGIGLPISQQIRAREEGETYKYLGVLEADEIKHEAKTGIFTLNTSQRCEVS